MLGFVSGWRLVAAEIERDRARNALATLQEKYDALLTDHLAYLNTDSTSAAGRTLPAAKQDALLVLAAERGGRDPALRRMLASYVRKQRLAGVDDETIADELTHWVDPEDEE